MTERTLETVKYISGVKNTLPPFTLRLIGMAAATFLAFAETTYAAETLAPESKPSDSGQSSTMKPRKPTDYYYDLLMSEDDAVCKPLARLYDRLLKDMTRTLVVPTEEEWQNNSELSLKYKAERIPYRTFFERTNPEEFEKIGFVKPPEAGTPQRPSDYRYMEGWPEGFLWVDLFHNGHHRLVWWHEQENTPGLDNLQTRFLIFKPGVTREDVGDPFHVDPALVEYFKIPGEETKKGEAETFLFDLPKMPHFKKLKKIFGGHQGLPFGAYDPAIGVGTVRIFLLRSKVYFVVNEFANMIVDSPIEGSMVLVYRMKPTGRDDVCYIGLAPSAIARIVKGKRND